MAARIPGELPRDAGPPAAHHGTPLDGPPLTPFRILPERVNGIRPIVARRWWSVARRDRNCARRCSRQTPGIGVGEGVGRANNRPSAKPVATLGRWATTQPRRAGAPGPASRTAAPHHRDLAQVVEIPTPKKLVAVHPGRR